METKIKINPETTCKEKECGITFRYNPGNSTIKPKYCPRCQSLKNFEKKKEYNQKMLAKSTLFDGKTKKAVRKPNNTPKSKSPENGIKKGNIDKQLDDAWSILVKLIAGYRCAKCGSRKSLNSHHIYSRANMSTKWHIPNGICLCVKHHIGVEFSAHKTPVDFTFWLVEIKGEKFLLDLKIKSNQTVHFHQFEKELLLKELQKEIKRFQK